MSPIYEYRSYKDCLRALIKENSEKRGYQASLARAAGCQSSYLSQVLTGKADLLLDHAAGIARFAGFNPFDTECFFTLVQLARANTSDLKKYLHDKLDNLKESNAQLSKRIPNAERTMDSIESLYFSSWYWSAVHVATSIEEYQTPAALAERFRLPLVRVKDILEKLVLFGFVKNTNSKWKYEKGAAHLPKESIMTELNHTHWRHRALLDTQMSSNESLHYTSVFTMSKKDFEKVREFLLQSITDSRKITDPSDPEEVFCFNLDYFKV